MLLKDLLNNNCISFYDFGFQFARVVGSSVLMIVSVPYLTIVIFLVAAGAYFVQKFYLVRACFRP